MCATPSDLQRLLDRARGRSVLVIGDLMLDHFLIGRVDRISPEAPVPVVQFDHEEYRLGGAANVAHNVAALGGHADVVGVAGADDSAARLLADLARMAIGTTGVVTDAERSTTRKLRVVTTRNQQVARIDYESDREIGGTLQDAVLRKVKELAARTDVVLISDYQKGTITAAVAAAAIEAARARGVPSLVDPKVPHIDRYAGATLVTPNHHEAEAVTLMRIRSEEEAREAAQRFRDRARCENVLITRGEHGMWLLGPDGEFDLPAEALEVSDVTGAGDTVIAAIALGLAAGGSLADAARLANRAAGLAVSRFGPAAITADELRAVL
ncbi:MAG: D-glycero-beta-D-manno-heptose-7-phosphate kinase [Acidobacteria bacterium]|nr:MAG: D-glycero-beta-D-manno-heptose-7-phosphate kinase [Acidobacteriota bacterium]